MKTVGFVGWRGMVGSVLLQRMQEENDFDNIEAIFFSTSQVNEKAPALSACDVLKDAHNIQQLMEMDIILTCQGGDYTHQVHPALRAAGWQGVWIDAASALRMSDDAIIVLDPINQPQIQQAIESGVKNFIGGNCTVSLMLMALGGLFKADLIEWMTSMTYQAASGAGAKNMQELIAQMGYLCNHSQTEQSQSALELDKKVKSLMNSTDFPQQNFKAPLAGSLIPWIDKLVADGQTKEEWKAFSETNKILQTKTPIPIDGTCVRIGAMRCHSQGFTIKLKKDVPLNEIESLIKEQNSWVKWVNNTPEDTLKHLSPANVTGTLDIPIGRVRKMNLGPEYLNAFTVGDQLLWGAAEPLRRTLNILLKN